MTYQSTEESVALGSPIELLHFYDEEGSSWNYCTGHEDKVFQYATYLHYPIRRSQFELGGTASAANLTIEMWKGCPLAAVVIDGPVDHPVHVVSHRLHSDAEWQVYWRGTVIGVKFSDEAVPTFHIALGPSSAVRKGGRRWNQRVCPLAHYGSGDGKCNLNPALFTIAGTVEGVLGLNITSSVFATKADGYFTNGLFIMGSFKRMIRAHTGSIITLNRIISSIAIGASFTARAGCNHLPATCRDTFDNMVNYGGNEFLPTENPHGGYNISY